MAAPAPCPWFCLQPGVGALQEQMGGLRRAFPGVLPWLGTPETPRADPRGTQQVQPHVGGSQQSQEEEKRKHVEYKDVLQLKPGVGPALEYLVLGRARS